MPRLQNVSAQRLAGDGFRVCVCVYGCRMRECGSREVGEECWGVQSVVGGCRVTGAGN